jgi:four helix bundle protein
MHQAEEWKKRSKELALRVFRLCRALPHTDEARIVGRQLLRCSSSVAANYRAVCRSRSEFVARMGVVVEEADETVFWLEFLVDAGIVSQEEMASLLCEANELVSIFAASQYTARTAVNQ